MSILMEKVKAELVLSSYATKGDLKRVTGIGTSTLASKADLPSLKTWMRTNSRLSILI